MGRLPRQSGRMTESRHCKILSENARKKLARRKAAQKKANDKLSYEGLGRKHS